MGLKDNLVPAVIIGAALIGGSMFLGGKGSKAAAPTTVAGATATSEGSSTSGPSTSEGEETTTTLESGEPTTSVADGVTTISPPEGGPTATAEGSAATTTVAGAIPLPDWSYGGPTGPKGWGALAGDEACAKGTEQSPIDIASTTPIGLIDPIFSYRPVRATIVNTGRAIEARLAAGAGMSLDGIAFPLETVVVHTPSEHELKGVPFPLELQFVHRAKTGEIAIVAVLFSAGAANPALDELIATMPAQSGSSKPLATPLDLGALLPPDSLGIRYFGSLTTPPCTEGVRWVVMNTVASASKDQIDKLTAMFPNNVRGVQPLNGRTVLIDSASGA